MRGGFLRTGLITTCLLLASMSAFAGQVRVAVASNFAETIRAIAALYQEQTGHSVLISTGSTGKHYAQIRNGAPFDVFLAADARRPALLEQEGIAQPGSRYTYAIGRLVLWSPKADMVDKHGRVLEQGGFRYLAIANPKLAPYGRAAQQFLESRGLWADMQGRLVRGENISQAYQYVASGNAELGLVAYAQIRQPEVAVTGSFWPVPQELYDPIEQQAVLLKDEDLARDFLDFVRSDEARTVIRSYGYGVP
ncbi:MAG: molybdate ABC transporter substrate-binding protein [Gammaproteobacteria bacterium]|nr:molybdate ABC transporter substrate-binding protein [Gammaproteobacteria bacterium]